MEFEVLQDLVRTITRNKVKQIEVLGNPGPEAGRTEELYDCISKDRFASDDEAAKHFFDSDAKNPNYRKLRNKLIRQLINTSFFIDIQQPMFSERGKAQYNCYRDYAAAFVLRIRDAKKSSVYLLQQVLEQSLKFEFTELTADICRHLRIQFSMSAADQSSHERFSVLHREYEEKRFWEFKALDYYENLAHHYIGGRSTNKEVHKQASAYFDELFPKVQEIDTLQYYLHVYTIGVIKYLSTNDCVKTIELCDEAIATLKIRKTVSRGNLVGFAMNKFMCLIQLRRFEDVESASQYCLELAETGAYNWFRVLEIQFYRFVYTREYGSALDTYRQATQHDRYSLMGSHVRDVWTLCGGYLHLLAALGKLDSQKVEEVVGFYRSSKFLNDFESLNKEKEGMNIPMVFLPIMMSITQNSYEEDFGRSFEALEKYRQRYLDNDINRRSAIFLKMLLILAKKSFEGPQADRKLDKEWAALQNEPPQLAQQSIAVEIIPYEDLWDMLSGL